MLRPPTTASSSIRTARLRTPAAPERGRRARAASSEVSWEAALGEIAQRLAGLPGETILNAHYTGTFAQLGYAFPLRFFNRLGATEVDPDTICNKAGHVALEYVYGTSLDGFDPRTARDANCIPVWGANCSPSAPAPARALASPRRSALSDRRRPGANADRPRRRSPPAAVSG